MPRADAEILHGGDTWVVQMGFLALMAEYQIGGILRQTDFYRLLENNDLQIIHY